MITVKIIIGKYSCQGLGETVFFKFDNDEDAEFLIDTIQEQFIKNITIIKAPSSYFKPWSELQEIMLQCV